MSIFDELTAQKNSIKKLNDQKKFFSTHSSVFPLQSGIRGLSEITQLLLMAGLDILGQINTVASVLSVLNIS